MASRQSPIVLFRESYNVLFISQKNRIVVYMGIHGMITISDQKMPDLFPAVLQTTFTLPVTFLQIGKVS
jgi:hypothetical protein